MDLKMQNGKKNQSIHDYLALLHETEISLHCPARIKMHATWAQKIFLLHLYGEVSEASFAAERAHLAGKAERATNEPHLGPSKLSYVQTGQLGRRPPRARPIHASARRGSHANICVRSLTRVTARWDRLLWGYGSFVALLSGFKNR